MLNNKPHTVVKLANEVNLKEAAIALNSEQSKLCQICYSLNENTILKKYASKVKTIKGMTDAMLNPNINKAINYFINFQLEAFYKIALSHKTNILLDYERGQIITPYLLNFSDYHLVPELYFEQYPEHILYQLQLKSLEEIIQPSKNKIRILLNEPAIIIVNQTIYKVELINANKIKPFLSKTEIIIPNRIRAEYFDKFVGQVVKKIDIKAKGFDVITKSNLSYTTIKPTYQISNEQVVFEIIFTYNEMFHFSNISPKSTHVTLQNENDYFYILKIIRDFEEEKKILKRLETHGIIEIEHQFLSFKTSENNPFENLEKLLNLQSTLEKNNIKIINQIGLKKIYNQPFKIEEFIDNKKDWFDVKITINCEGFSIPFTNLLPYLKSNERFYPINDELFFLIPNEWFSKYENFVQFGKVENGIIKFLPSHEAIVNQVFQTKVNQQTLFYKPSNTLKAELRPYQIEGINWLLKHYEKHTGCCLADDMGLGKTLQVLAYLNYIYETFPEKFHNEWASFDLFSNLDNNKNLKALVVVPSSLIYNWQLEIKKFTPHFSCLSYSGINRKEYLSIIDNYDIIITSYPVLLRDLNFFKTKIFNFLIIDEGQYIKNRQSKIFKAINDISASHRISLSGTPIENSLSDLWSQMQFTNPDILKDYKSFYINYQLPIEKHQDETVKQQLKIIVNDYILRRLKSDVLKDLPALSQQIVYASMTHDQQKLYEDEKSKVRNFILEQLEEAGKLNQINVLAALMKLRQIANHPHLIGNFEASGKFEVIIQQLEELQKSKQKALIFSSFVEHLKIYEKWCGENAFEFAHLHGDMSLQSRKKQIEKFQKEDQCKFFFISLKAGGTGLNLTQAKYVFLLDPWWNPFAENQAIARAHRMGQKNKVHVYKFISKDTLEEKILQMQQEKTSLSDDILDNNQLNTFISNLSKYL